MEIRTAKRDGSSLVSSPVSAHWLSGAGRALVLGTATYDTMYACAQERPPELSSCSWLWCLRNDSGNQLLGEIIGRPWPAWLNGGADLLLKTPTGVCHARHLATRPADGRVVHRFRDFTARKLVDRVTRGGTKLGGWFAYANDGTNPPWYHHLFGDELTVWSTPSTGDRFRATNLADFCTDGEMDTLGNNLIDFSMVPSSNNGGAVVVHRFNTWAPAHGGLTRYTFTVDGPEMSMNGPSRHTTNRTVTGLAAVGYGMAAFSVGATDSAPAELHLWSPDHGFVIRLAAGVDGNVERGRALVENNADFTRQTFHVAVETDTGAAYLAAVAFRVGGSWSPVPGLVTLASHEPYLAALPYLRSDSRHYAVGLMALQANWSVTATQEHLAGAGPPAPPVWTKPQYESAADLERPIDF